MADDPHSEALNLIKQLSEKRAKAHTGEEPYPFSFDALGEAVSIDELFKGKLSREKLYARLLGLSADVQFKDWIVPKLKLSFSAAMERDTRMMSRTRIKNYEAAKKSSEAMVENVTAIMNKLQVVNESK